MTDEEGRALVMNVQGDLWQMGLTDDRGRDAMNYKRPAIQFQNATLADLNATKADLEQLRQYVSENTDLDPEFYENKIKSFELQISGFEVGYPVPQLTVEEEANETISGVVDSVDDGDTILIDGREIRLAGIDTPEKGTERGQAATEKIKELTLGKNVTVKIDQYQGVDVYGRILGVVFLPDGTNVNLEMVKSCAAEVNSKFGRHQYIDADEFKRAGEACSATWAGEGIIKVYSGKTHAKIYVDGVDTGKIAPAEISMPLGQHEIMVTISGYTPDTQTVQVSPGKVELLLNPIKMPAMTGTLEIVSTPSGAEFVIDDMPMGMTPTELELSSEIPHTISMYLEGYKPEVVTVLVPAGKRVKIVGELSEV